MTKILVVEDDFFLRDGLSELLTKEGYEPVTAQNAAEAQARLTWGKYSLIILDVMLPDGSGLDICTPVLFLTACDDEIQIVRGLDSGADDYVTKPFRLQELLSRIRALLRRSELADKPTESGGISLERSSMTVRKNGENVFVTPTEYQILSMLMHGRGVTVTRTLLLQNIWDDNGSFIDDNTLSVHISRLREKIGAEHIVTVRGVGYRWEDGNE